MRPEERRRYIDSIPEASIIDARKENIVPRKEGRSMSSLNKILSMDTTERERAIAEGKARFEEQIENLEGLRDPLDVFIKQAAWIIEMFPEGSIEDDIMTLLHDATNRFRTDERYKHDPRYLKLWVEYATWVEEPEEIFRFLFKNGIGRKYAMLYDEFASFLMSSERYDDAIRVYKMGIKAEASPLEPLQRNYEESKKVIAERKRLGLIKQKEDESRRRMNEMKANNRTLLGEKIDSRSKISFSANVFPAVQSNLGLPSRPTSSSFGNDRSSSPTTSNNSSPSTSKISVFQDTESSSSSASSRQPSSTFSIHSTLYKSSSSGRPSQFKPTTSSSSQFENRITAERYSGITIPQAQIDNPPPTSSFVVHVDSSEEQEPVRQLDRNNSSLLSESSGESSLSSRIRKFPMEEVEGSHIKRSRLDNRSEKEIMHAKRREEHFIRNQMYYMIQKDSKDREEVMTVLRITHFGTSFEEERAICLGMPYKKRIKEQKEEDRAFRLGMPYKKNKEEKEEEEQLSGFDSYYLKNKVKAPDVGFTTETRKAVGTMREFLFSDDNIEEEEKDLTWTNPVQRLNLPKYQRKRDFYGSEN